MKSWPQGELTISEVVLVGAATRMPCVSRMLSALTGVAARKAAVDPDLAVATGAAIKAAMNDALVADPDDFLVIDSWQSAVIRHFAKGARKPRAGSPLDDDDDDDDDDDGDDDDDDNDEVIYLDANDPMLEALLTNAEKPQ